MVKQIIAMNEKARAIYRFIGKYVFIKSGNNQYTVQLIQQIESKGGKIEFGRNWIKCDLIGEHTFAKLGDTNIDISVDTEKEIEDKFFNFFKFTLERAGFKLTIVEV